MKVSKSYIISNGIGKADAALELVQAGGERLVFGRSIFEKCNPSCIRCAGEDTVKGSILFALRRIKYAHGISSVVLLKSSLSSGEVSYQRGPLQSMELAVIQASEDEKTSF